jgi:hypothetical protein
LGLGRRITGKLDVRHEPVAFSSRLNYSEDKKMKLSYGR